MAKSTATLTVSSRHNIDLLFTEPQGPDNWPMVFDVVKMTNINEWGIGQVLHKADIDEFIARDDLNVHIIEPK